LILASNSKNDLFDLMNPGIKPRHHKLNMQNLKTNKRHTVEFRQHSATTNCQSVEAWVRFCMNFVYNSVDCCVLPPVVFDESTTGSKGEETRIDVLFDCLIQDQKLKLYYKMQREKLLLVTSLAPRGKTPTELLPGANGKFNTTTGKGGGSSGIKNSRTFGFIDTRKEEYGETFRSFSGDGTFRSPSDDGTFRSFSGAGTTLGAGSGGTDGNSGGGGGDDSDGIFDPSSLPAPNVDSTTEEGDTTSIAVRMLDGKRKIIKIRLDATIEELASLIVEASNTTISIPFRIVSGFPPKPIISRTSSSNADDDDGVSKVTTISDSGLKGAQIQLQKA